MFERITDELKLSIKSIYSIDSDVELTRPDEQYGDYTSNIALKLAGQLSQQPIDIANSIAKYLNDKLKDVCQVTAINPGFINFSLSDKVLMDMLDTKLIESEIGKVVVVEYSDPNPFKVLHAGHLYTSVVGDAIANLLQTAGATVHRVNFGGDVGMHVAKTLWAMTEELGDSLPTKYAKLSIDERADWMAKSYVEGNRKFEEDEVTKSKITKINKQVYEFIESKDLSTTLAQTYWMTREWSYEYFKEFYKKIGSEFERFYAESEVQNLGLMKVREQQKKGIFEESNGAVVFKGEKYGLHTRVFINSEGLPTYETKDIGLIFQKFNDYKFDKSIIITANEQEQYQAVVQKSLEQFAPELVAVSVHLTHGLVKLAGGVKMGSRLGNFLRATDVIESVQKANLKITGKDNFNTVLGAVKYSFLKTRTGGDIVYDPVESVSIEGNSGPYLQYAYARAMSILDKIQGETSSDNFSVLNDSDRLLVRKLTRYNEVIESACSELMPHLVCTYLYELAQTFNRFYENNRVIGDERQDFRASLVTRYASTLKKGLDILGIPSPSHI